MKKALLVALTLVISLAFVTAVFAQAPGMRQDTAPSTAPTGEKKAPAPEKATKAKKPAKEQSGVKEESTAASEGKKTDKGPAPKAPKGGGMREDTAVGK